MNDLKFLSGKSTMMKGAIIGAGIVVLIVAGFLLFSQGSAGEKISYGDTVTLSYTMYYAKNNTQIAETDELKLKVGDSRISAAFDKKLLGMKNGDKKKFTLTVDDAFGRYNLNLIRQYPKFNTFDRTMVVTLEEIRSTTTSQYNISEGAEIRTAEWSWPILIQKIDKGDVTIYHKPVLNSLYVDPLILIWPLKVVKLTNATVTIEQMPRIGSVVDDETLGRGRVVYIEQDRITADYNKLLAGNDITFEVTIQNMQKPA